MSVLSCLIGNYGADIQDYVDRTCLRHPGHRAMLNVKTGWLSCRHNGQTQCHQWHHEHQEETYQAYEAKAGRKFERPAKKAPGAAGKDKFGYTGLHKGLEELKKRIRLNPDSSRLYIEDVEKETLPRPLSEAENMTLKTAIEDRVDKQVA